MGTAEERIARLEQQLTRVERALERAQKDSHGSGWGIRVFAIGISAAVFSALVMGTAAAKPGPQSLTVKAPFTVVTKSGKALDVNALGQLTLYRSGRPIIVLGPAEDAAGVIDMLSPSGETVAELSSLADGTGQLAVVGDDDQVARLGASPNHLGQLSLRFYNGKTIQAGIGGAKSGLMELYDPAGKKMVELGSNGTTGTIGIYDASGSARALLASDPTTGEGEFTLLYKDGTTPAVKLSEVSAGGYFALTNRSGISRIEGGTLPSDQGILRTFGPGGFDFVEGRK